MINEKQCSKCKQVKSIENFSERSANKDGKEGICAACATNYQKEYYLKNREKILRQTREYRINLGAAGREEQNRRMREYRAKNCEYFERYKKQYLQKQKLKLFQKISGLEKPICSTCGCDDLRLLEINHINGGGQREYKKRGTRSFYALILNDERKTNDLNILCRVCNSLHYLQLKYGNIPIKITWEAPKSEA